MLSWTAKSTMLAENVTVHFIKCLEESAQYSSWLHQTSQETSSLLLAVRLCFFCLAVFIYFSNLPVGMVMSSEISQKLWEAHIDTTGLSSWSRYPSFSITSYLDRFLSHCPMIYPGIQIINHNHFPLERRHNDVTFVGSNVICQQELDSLPAGLVQTFR